MNRVYGFILGVFIGLSMSAGVEAIGNTFVSFLQDPQADHSSEDNDDD